MISGTPTTVSTATYSVRAFNSMGASNPAAVTLTITGLVPSLSFNQAAGTVGTRNAAMSVSPTQLLTNGHPISNCSITPALPAGLSLNTSTCRISGTPSVTLPSTVFGVTASNAVGASTQALVTLAVVPSCPSGYVGVPGSPLMGTDDFCVMQYEAKCAGTSCPTSIASSTAQPASIGTGYPWTNLTAGQAKAACNQLGFEYDLISNPEWMTIARHIEGVAANWSGGAVQSGCLMRGNVGILDNCSYNGQDPEMGTSRDLKASHLLASSARIWDFSGNVWEWVDWNLSTGLQRGPLSCAASSFELDQVSCSALIPTDYRPLQAMTSLQGAGVFFGGAGGAALRGGNWSSANSAGAFSLFLSNSTSTAGTPFGFRCVMRPNTPPSVPLLSYFGSTGTVASIGQSMSIVPTTLSTGGAAITSCTVNPALPIGLSINPSTCVISGTPAQGVNNVTYSVVAGNANGNSAAAFVTITTSAQAPALSYVGATGTSGSVGASMSVTPTTLNTNGSALINCTITPTLPYGLTINPSTCVISGVPANIASETSYSVRAQNSVGQSSAASVVLSVTSAPSLSYLGASGTIGLVGQSISVAPTTLSSFATLSSCVSTPALPAGLSLNPQTCVITGTVSAPVTGTYSIVATSSIGASAPASVTLMLGANSPVLSYLGASGTVGASGVPMSIAPTTLNNNGSPLTYCGVRIPTTPLPAWASVNPVTCVISGTPTAPMGSTTYLMRASNAAGPSVDAPVTLRVDASVPSLSYATSTGTSGGVNQPMSVVPSTILSNGSAITSCSVSPTLPPGLSLSATTCVISGTPTSIFGPASFAVRATNGIGQSAIANVILSTAPSVPNLSYAGSAGTLGSLGNLMTVTPTVLNSNGSAITNCSVTPALPAGLSLNSLTCVISGTPSALTASTSYSITATNGIGTSNAASVTLQVIDVPSLSYVGSTGTSGTAGFAMSVTPTSLVTNGAGLISCTASPALPAGLTLNASTCVISGTPTVSIGATIFNITAANAAGSSLVAPVTLTIAAGAPTLSYFGSTGTNGTLNLPMTITPTTLNNNGSPITNCSVTPALPAGFTLNALTCVISGTPTVSISATTFAVTATNAQGPSTAANVILSTGANPPTISFSGATGLEAQLGTVRSIAPTSLSFNGTPVTNCTVSPALPAGLSINITTCVISGTVSTTFSTNFSVTAINGAGASTPANVLISSTPSVPTLSFATSTGTTGQAGQPMSVAPSAFNNNGSAITNCIVTPALPAGLLLNPATCAISGTPTVVIAPTTYSVRASNSIGTSAPASVTLTINPGPPGLSFIGATGTFGAIGASMTITPTALQTNGAAITSCSAAPALPAGLSVNASTCVISGTPSVAVPLASYTITATNSVGSTNATVSLSTAVDPPVLSYVGSIGTAGSIGDPLSVTPSTLNDNGAPLLNCGVRIPTTPLPSWASVNPVTCVISGVPDAALAPTLFTLIATNVAGDSADATVILSVGASAPSLSYVASTGTSGVIAMPMTITPSTFSNNGSPITSCAAAPALPAGLSIDTSTCVISGTPSSLLSATTYFV
ncbi:MAG: beta strand repeat-containing protein, partial [Bacteriovoracia bacterium]